MSNLNDPRQMTADRIAAARVAERAGAEHLGASVYELAPGDEMVFHYHVQREELLIVLSGELSLRTAVGWEQLPEGEVVAFPRAERGAHGYRNASDRPVRVLMISEMTGPNISVYPDTHQVGVFDAGHRAQRRFCALFNVADAVADYAGKAEIVPPAPGPRTRRNRNQVREEAATPRLLFFGLGERHAASRTAADKGCGSRSCVASPRSRRPAPLAEGALRLTMADASSAAEGRTWPYSLERRHSTAVS